MHRPGFEPGLLAWKAKVMPLDHQCLITLRYIHYTFLLIYVPEYFPIHLLKIRDHRVEEENKKLVSADFCADLFEIFNAFFKRRMSGEEFQN